MDFNGKNVWIVGASSGIGEALARQLSRSGANLLLSARREAELARVQHDCGVGDRVQIFPVDVCDERSIASAADACRRRFERLDIVICCCGISQRSLAVETELHVNRRLMDVNFFGPVAVVQAVLPDMLRRHAGQIVLISSLAGKFGTPMRSGYAASKHALHGYFSSLRAEVRRQGVSVSLVCPGYVSTGITLNSLRGDGSSYGILDEHIRKAMPVDRCAEKIARGILRNREEIIVGGLERFAVPLQRFFPRIFSKLVSNVKIK